MLDGLFTADDSWADFATRGFAISATMNAPDVIASCQITLAADGVQATTVADAIAGISGTPSERAMVQWVCTYMLAVMAPALRAAWLDLLLGYVSFQAAFVYCESPDLTDEEDARLWARFSDDMPFYKAALLAGTKTRAKGAA